MSYSYAPNTYQSSGAAIVRCPLPISLILTRDGVIRGKVSDAVHVEVSTVPVIKLDNEVVRRQVQSLNKNTFNYNT